MNKAEAKSNTYGVKQVTTETLILLKLAWLSRVGSAISAASSVVINMI